MGEHSEVLVPVQGNKNNRLKMRKVEQERLVAASHGMELQSHAILFQKEARIVSGSWQKPMGGGGRTAPKD